MKPTVSYVDSEFQMGDLLTHYRVPFEEFTDDELESLRNNIIDYMKFRPCEEIKVDLKSIYLLIKGEDEASMLLYYL